MSSKTSSYDFSDTPLADQIRIFSAAVPNWSLNEFEDHVKKLDVGDRTISIPKHLALGDNHGSSYINFYNVPKGKAQGAVGENNRIAFSVEGFDKSDPDAPAPGKVKIEQRVNAIGREWKLRAKSGTPQAILAYLESFLKKVVSEAAPKIRDWE